jgi:D-aminopeptidase
VAAYGSGKAMPALEQMAVKQGGSAYSAAKRNHDRICRTARSAAAIFAEKSEARVVLQHERQMKLLLAPSAQIEARGVVKLRVGG